MTWWNTGGVWFLALFGGAAGVAFVVSVAGRVLVGATPRSGGGRPPSTIDLAYLEGGAAHAALACVVGLHRVGAVNRGPMLTLDVTGPLPNGAPPLMAAVHGRLREPCSWVAVLADPDVRNAGARLHRKLVRRGLLASDTRRRWARVATVPLWAVVALGLLRLASFVGNGAEAGRGPTAGIVVVTGVAALAAWMLAAPPRVTRAGRAALRAAAADVREAERRREGGREPSARELMRSVAVRGPAELAAVDPVFGDAVGAHRPLRPAPPQRMFSWEYDSWRRW